MCGIAGILQLDRNPTQGLSRRIATMNDIQKHRGPDGDGIWEHPNHAVAFGHRRLSVIDLDQGSQPMTDGEGLWITYNGEIYNYRELRDELGADSFRTASDTEVVLRTYRRYGRDCVHHLRGMFAFAIWDERKQSLFCARDRFGIKPFYFAEVGNTFYFASEAKALLPYLSRVETDLDAFRDYLAFQFTLGEKTLFRGVRQLAAGHRLEAGREGVTTEKYWEVFYDLDFDHTSSFFERRLHELILDSTKMHLRADVPVGSYVSGGFDSSLIASLAAKEGTGALLGFTGKFGEGVAYDESRYARLAAENAQFELHELTVTASDFVEHLPTVIYHLDYPVAGPGSFPQYMVSGLAAQHRKVVLGGQGGDEIFGGYTRYLIAYFEQCIKAAIDGTSDSGNFIVTYESIIPNLGTLREYKPLLQEFWRDGLFEDLDARYFRLVNRSNAVRDEVYWDRLGEYSPFETFLEIFRAPNVQKESYFDAMTHFDFKTLLPALLHVEDRVSMAHGLEARVPFLDHPLVEFAATMPSNVKFEAGAMKHVLKKAMGRHLPRELAERRDKMGFPVPLKEWSAGPIREFVCDILATGAQKHRELVDYGQVLRTFEETGAFGRQLWGFLSLELWHQKFHDAVQQAN